MDDAAITSNSKNPSFSQNHHSCIFTMDSQNHHSCISLGYRHTRRDHWALTITLIVRKRFARRL
eukprot:1366676-Rhodomonas_salina.1